MIGHFQVRKTHFQITFNKLKPRHLTQNGETRDKILKMPLVMTLFKSANTHIV